MSDLAKLQSELDEIKTRNKRVEANKAWETSWSRKVTLVILTYVVAGFTLKAINNPNPFTNALIPTIGFFLSTLTIPFLRTLWEKYIYKK